MNIPHSHENKQTTTKLMESPAPPPAPSPAPLLFRVVSSVASDATLPMIY